VVARDQTEFAAARDELAARGIASATVICDVTDRVAATALLDEVVADRGRLDEQMPLMKGQASGCRRVGIRRG
jgi:hypothetical protein